MKKKKRKNKGAQYKFRRKVFDFDQYWNINYTEKYKDGSERDFKTFIRAKSYDLAKEILIEKLKDEDPSIKVKAVQGFMFHGNYKIHKNRRLTFENWEQIKKASFPNYNNILFKKEITRKEGYTNRFNKTDISHILSIGFKKGKDNWSHQNRKGIYLPIEERKGMIYKGKWVKWDEKEMEKTKKQIIDGLELHKNNKLQTAKYLKISRNALYSMMSRIEPMDWWNKNYPYVRLAPPRIPTEVRSRLQKDAMQKRMEAGEIPFGNLTEDQKKRKVENIKKAKARKRDIFYKDIIPKIKNALPKFNNSRKKTAEHLNLKQSH